MSKHKKKKKWYRLFFLHRYTGLSVAVFAIVLSVTGILLNHTEELGLHNQNVSTPWLMGMYGIKAPEIKQVFSLNDVNPNQKHWVIEFGSNIYLNNRELDCKPPLSGAIKNEELFIVGNQTQLCLFTHEAELIDSLALPLSNPVNLIKRLGKDKSGRIVVDTSAGLLAVNPDYTAFIATVDTEDGVGLEVKWLIPSQAPEVVVNSLKNQFKGEGLPLERIILDLHSGRIVGLAGVYFMDLVALLLIFLAVSGVITWANRKKKKGQKNKV